MSTWPSSLASVVACLTTRTLSRADFRSAFAASNDSPTTFGTEAGAGPLETTIVTAVCFLTVLPAAGSCAITWPAGVSESRLSKFGINPASRIWVSAASCC